jgi:hypothetical protein
MSKPVGPENRRDYKICMYLTESEFYELEEFILTQTDKGRKQAIILRTILMPIIRKKLKEFKK